MGRPVRGGQCLEILGIRMIVQIRHDQQCDRALALGLDGLLQRVGVLGGDETVERTRGVSFTGLMVEDQDNSPAHVNPLIIITPLRSDDPIPGECELALRHATGTGTEAMRVEVNASRKLASRRAAGSFESTRRNGQRRDQVVPQEERAIARTRFEFEARKPGGDELGGEAILRSRGEAPAKGAPARNTRSAFK